MVSFKHSSLKPTTSSNKSPQRIKPYLPRIRSVFTTNKSKNTPTVIHKKSKRPTIQKKSLLKKNYVHSYDERSSKIQKGIRQSNNNYMPCILNRRKEYHRKASNRSRSTERCKLAIQVFLIRFRVHLVCEK